MSKAHSKLVANRAASSTRNAFCPTGRGGGQDNSCGSRGGLPLGQLVKYNGKEAVVARATRASDTMVTIRYANGMADQVSIDSIELLEGSGNPDQGRSNRPRSIRSDIGKSRKVQSYKPDTRNVFCATGEGGGQDNSCSGSSASLKFGEYKKSAGFGAKAKEAVGATHIYKITTSANKRGFRLYAQPKEKGTRAEYLGSFRVESQAISIAVSHNLGLAGNQVHLTANLSFGKVRQERLRGREYLVAPVTLIVPGVLNGSKGPLFYPPEELSKTPDVWNKIPIVVYHPHRNGSPVSAYSEGILDESGVGFLQNTHINQQGRLRAEGWFDVEHTKRVDRRILENLKAGRTIEVSTGLYTENEPAPSGSTWNGRAYSFVARSYKPDHLAILPDQVGACSVQDGCGVLVNAKSSRRSQAVATRKRRKAVTKNAFCATGKGQGKDNSCSSKEGSKGGSSSDRLASWRKSVASVATGGHSDRHAKLKEELSRVATGKRHPSVTKTKPSKMARFKKQLAKLFFSENAMKSKTQTENKKSRKTLTKNQEGGRRSLLNSSRKEPSTMANRMKPDERETIVDGLIANGCCWKEDDRETLESLSDQALLKLNEQAKYEAEQAVVVNAVRTSLKLPEALTLNEMPEAMAAALAKKKSTMKRHPSCDDEEVTNQDNKDAKKAVTNALTPEQQEDIAFARSIKQERKDVAIKVITANKQNKFTKEQLAEMSLDMLVNMAVLAKPVEVKADASDPVYPSWMGAASPVSNRGGKAEDDEDILPLPVMNFEPRDKAAV